VTTTAPTAHLIAPGDGEIVHVHALGVRFLLEGAATDGRLAIVEHPLPPRALGAPPHTHRHEDEYSFVLEGRLGVQLGRERFTADPGELVVKPRGIEHAFWNASDAPLRILELISPAGFEGYFRELARALADRDESAQREIIERYELDIDHASIPAFAAEVGARLA
jgi:quercetin dioxygenase-like cupin family protein